VTSIEPISVMEDDGGMLCLWLGNDVAFWIAWRLLAV
jgi:hypothetical protein